MRLVTVNDLDKAEAQEMSKILGSTKICSDLRVVMATSISMTTGEAKDQVQAQFKVRPTNLNNVIKVLNAHGFCTFDVSALLATTEDVPGESSSTFRSWLPGRVGGSRISTLEMHTNISGHASFTFDHGLLIVLACFLAAYGLLMDSAVNILAAFFVSPLMNMILVSAWGFVIQDYQLVRRGMINVVLGASFAWAIGVAMGCLVCHWRTRSVFMREHDIGVLSMSNQILSRGPPWEIAWGGTAIIASVSGVTVALGQSTGVANALAGVTMAASLLPPLVNSGMCTLMGFVHPEVRTANGDTLHEVAVVSLGIYVVTVPLVMLFAFVVFKFKHIGGRSLFMGRAANAEALGQLSVMSQAARIPRGERASRSVQSMISMRDGMIAFSGLELQRKVTM